MIALDKIIARLTDGGCLEAGEAVQLWSCDYYDLLHAANKVRLRWKGETVNLCSIINAKSGVCSENCKFCAQSAHHATAVTAYPMVDASAIAAHFAEAEKAGAGCFGIVTSGRRLSENDVATLCAAAGKLKGTSVRLGASLGELDEPSLRRLKESGVVRFHHNLETAESFFPNICTTHKYADRVKTIRAAKALGMEVCSGGLFGLGETREQRLELALTLRELDVDSVPMNFLNPVPGTPFAHQPPLPVREILMTIAVFRLVLPAKDITVCGGREINLRDLQSWVFFAGANGIMVGGYLTTPGRAVAQDRQMINDLGLQLKNG